MKLHGPQRSIVPLPTVAEIREKLGRVFHPYTDATEIRVLLARIDELESEGREGVRP